MAQMTRLVLAASVGLALSGGLFAAAPTVSTEDFVDKIESPWDMAFMKDGTMFFTEKCRGLSVRLPSGTQCAVIQRGRDGKEVHGITTQRASGAACVG